MAKIIYFGVSKPSSTSRHRLDALKRLGHDVEIYDPEQEFMKTSLTKWDGVFHFRTGYVFLQKKICKWLKGILETSSGADLVWINNGEYFGANFLKILKNKGLKCFLYINDDPFNKRDGHRFDSLTRSLKYYDAAAAVREETQKDLETAGINPTFRIYMSYDEVMHAPYERETDIPEKFRSEVAFIGTWMRYEKRDEFILELINEGVPVSIWGDRWSKSPHWETLKKHYRGGAIGGRDYVASIQGAKICLGLLSKGNRDQHTQRSLETPYAGGLLCAERTPEHLAMYRENIEAVFWSDAAECAKICKKLLQDDDWRNSIREAGMRRVRELKLGNEDICQQILSELSIV